MSRKHCWKRRNCSLGAISPFPAVFSTDPNYRHVKNQGFFGKGLTEDKYNKIEKKTPVKIKGLTLIMLNSIEVTFEDSKDQDQSTQTGSPILIGTIRCLNIIGGKEMVLKDVNNTQYYYQISIKWIVIIA